MQTDGAFSAQGALDEVDRAISSSSDPDRALLDLTIGAVRQNDPELAEAIRYCAIPRRLDAEIVGVLREARQDCESNQKLLAGLVSLHLVSLRSDSGYVYQDRRRALLLDYWRSEPDKRAQFDLFNQRLVTYYEAQHVGAQELEHDLERVKSALLNASSKRHVQVASAVRQRVLAPLFEALYHETLRSAESGYALFSRDCEAHEARGLLTVCELLRTSERDNLLGLPPGSGQEGPLKWVQYWEARIFRSYRRYAEAEAILRELLPNTEDETTLRLWTMGELGATLHEQTKLREANEMYLQELALAERTRRDPYNLPVSYSRVASLHWSLGEMDHAAARYRDAVACARRERNQRVEGLSLFDLAGVLQDRGEWSDALNAALEGLHLARTRDAQDRNIQQSAATRLMSLVGRRDPGLLDTLFKEAERLSGNPIASLDLRDGYVNRLQSSGQIERAVQVLAELLRDAADQSNSVFGVELRFSRALLDEAQGRLDEALAQYDEVIRATQAGLGTIWHLAAALSNQSLLCADCARWTEAESASQKALEQWRNIGHEKLGARVRVFFANALRSQGRLAESQKLLDEASTALEGAQASFWAEFHRTQADVYRDQAQWAPAHRHYLQAATYHRSVDQIKDAAQALNNLTGTACSQGHWEKAARYSAEALELWRRLEPFEHYQPTPRIESADEENAEGMSHFFAPGENRKKNLMRARESFRTAAARVPDNFWYLLNLAHASAGLEDWPDAALAVEQAIACAPPWLRSPVLCDWLAEYRLKQAAAQFRAGHFSQAHQIYSQVRPLLEGRVKPDLLLKIIMGAGDSSLKLEDWATAGAEYESGLELATSSGDAPNQATFHARLGFRAASLHDLHSAVEHFRAATGLTTSDLVDCSQLVTSLPQYHGFSQAMRMLEADPEFSSDRRRLLGARLEVSRLCYRRSLRPLAAAAKDGPNARVPLPTPIALEADARLFPEGPEKPQDRLVSVDLPEMRKRIESSMGVQIPGVRIRSSTVLGEGGYAFVLNDVPRAFATVYIAERYCPDSSACESKGILGRPSVNPWDGKPGMWLPDSAVEQAASEGMVFLDAYQYMLAHLEWFVRRNLCSLVGVQEVHEMLERWAKDNQERRELLDSILHNTESRVRFTHVLQGLLREEVPVADLAAILTAFAAASPLFSDVREVVEHVRPALRTALPGNEATRHRIVLSGDFEGILAVHAPEQLGKRFLALPPEVAQTLLSDLRARLQGVDQGNAAIVVRQPGLRPFVRRLSEFEFPWLPVIAEQELTAGLPPVSERVEAVSPQGAASRLTV